MERREKILILAVFAAIVAMVIYDRIRVRSGVLPLVAQEAEKLDNLGDMVVGESNTEPNPVGVGFMTRNRIWGWPLPSMLPTAAGQ